MVIVVRWLVTTTKQAQQPFSEALHRLRVGHRQLEIALPTRRIGVHERRLALALRGRSKVAEQLRAGRQ